MPVGYAKNAVYGLMLPLVGRKSGVTELPRDNALLKILKKRRVQGFGLQTIRKRQLGGAACGGLIDGRAPVTARTIFRTASIAKMATAMLIARMQTLGLLSIDMDISDMWGGSVRNPMHIGSPILLRHMLSHTSGMTDAALYGRVLSGGMTASEIMQSPQLYTSSAPGKSFLYSNIAGGLLGCLMEKHFGRSFEDIAQEYLFEPLGVTASFDLTKLPLTEVSGIRRVMPKSSAAGFDPKRRAEFAEPLSAPDPEKRYFLTSGGLFITAAELARLALALMDGGGFIDEKLLREMKTPISRYPSDARKLYHGLGILIVDDRRVCREALFGHQGAAYGAFNGVFVGESDGFAFLNGGASEQRTGNLARVNEDIIKYVFG